MGKRLEVGTVDVAGIVEVDVAVKLELDPTSVTSVLHFY